MTSHLATVRRFLIQSAAVLGLCAACAGVMAQPTWKPERGVEIVVGSSPGGGTDITARLLQKIMQDRRLIDSAIVVNKPGGGQTVAWAYLNQHTGNGHYVSIVNEPLITNRIMGVSALSYRNFTPLGLLFREYVVFLVKSDSMIKTGLELAALLKKDAGGLTFGQGSSRGNNAHTTIGLLGMATGGDLKNQKMVVFKSGGETLTALQGGHIDIGVSTVAAAIQHIRAGRVRALATTSERRLGGDLADTPTWKEQGIDVVYGSWRVFFGPHGMSRMQIAFWEDALNKVSQTEEWRVALERNQQENAYLSAEDTKKFLDTEEARLAPLFADLGLAKPAQK